MKNRKKSLVILSTGLMLVVGSVFASFPVKSTVKQTETVNQVNMSSDVVIEKQAIDKKITQLKKAEVSSKDNSSPVEIDNDMLITLLLWFFLGALAAHRWYKKKPVGWNILFILTAGGCGVWAIIDLVNILTGKF